MGLCIKEGSRRKRIVSLGSGTSFDVSSYPGYQNFTVENFRIASIRAAVGGMSYLSGPGNANVSGPTNSYTFSMSYNPSTGILTIEGSNISYGYSSSGPWPDGGVRTMGGSANITLTPAVELIY